MPLLAILGCAVPVHLNVPKLELTQENANFQLEGGSETFVLVKLVNGVDRGEKVLAFPVKSHSNFNICNFYFRGSGGLLVTYVGGKRYLGNWSTELGRAFHETLSGRGYDIAGDPTELFSRQEAVSSARYQIAGRLVDMKGEFCEEHSRWDGSPLNIMSGEMYVEFEWSVKDTIQRKVVLKTITKGYFKQENSIPNGLGIVFENAFVEAVEGLSTKDELISLAKGQVLESKSATTLPSKGISIVNGRKGNEFVFSKYEPNLIIVSVGSGHGSGFFIGDEGYAITNAHVVGGAEQVRIKMSNGIELVAKVIAKNPIRDVALLKAPIRTKTPLFIDLKVPAVADNVYAVGSPLTEDLQSTVTKGIVSGHRKDKSSGQQFIQADAAISPGNSGGPLFNQNGGVVGISVLKFAARASEGLGFFIPIGNALQSLGIAIK